MNDEQTIILTGGPMATQAALDELEANCVAEFKDIGARLAQINLQEVHELLAELRHRLAAAGL